MSPLTYARRRPNLTAFAGVLLGTLTCYLAAGAVLPVLPRYITGPLHGTDVAVGLVVGAYAFTAIVGRPIGGRLTDTRGRKPVALAGLAFVALAGVLYQLPLGVPGLLVARLALGVGQGWAFTAGLAWAVDLAPEPRRGQTIALFGLSVWAGLSFGPMLGDAVLQLTGSYAAVWALATVMPLAGALLVGRVPERRSVDPGAAGAAGRGGLLPSEALAPGLALLMASVGYATMMAFVVLYLDSIAVGHGTAVFTAFATTVVVGRLALSWLPDRFGARIAAIAAAVAQCTGLVLIATADSLVPAAAGALLMGSGFSLTFPALALLVVQRVDPSRRGTAMGAFTAFFDIGVGVGAPVAGAISSVAGYPAAFGAAAALAAVGAAITALGGRSPTRPARPSPGRPRR